jgi:Tol biopolymer transport system component
MRSAADRLGASGLPDLERFERFRLHRARVERYKVIAIAAAVAMVVAVLASQMAAPHPSEPAIPMPPAMTGLIVFGRSSAGLEQRSLFTVRPDGTGEERLPVTYTDCGDWSPDGSTLHVTASEYPGAPLRPALVHPDGSDFRILDVGYRADLNLGCGDWSSDGSHLVLEGFGDPASVDGIYIVDASAGSNLTRVTQGMDVVPQFAPDGSAIVFQRSAPEGSRRSGAALFVVNTDGSDLKRITPWGAAVSAGSWSVQGSIVFAGPKATLWTVRPDGTQLQQMSHNLPGRAFQPRWSPDGTQIALGIRTAGHTDIYTVSADGSGRTKITDTQDADEWWPDWNP